MARDTFYLFLKFGNILGTIPWINLEQNKLVDKKLARCYPFFILIVMIVYYFLSLRTLFEYINFGGLFFLTSTIFVTIQSTCVKRKYWNKWMELYQETRREFRTKFNQPLELGWKPVVMFLFYTALCPVIETIRIYIELDDIKNIGVATFFKNFTEFIPTVLLLVITNGFRILNKYVKRLSTDHRTQNVALKNRTISKAILCANMYRNLYELSVCFNNLFGWILATNLLHFLISAICFTHYMIQYVFEKPVTIVSSMILLSYNISRLVS